MYPAANELDVTRYSVSGGVIHHLVRRPELQLIKLFGCPVILITGFSEDLIGLPLLHAYTFAAEKIQTWLKLQSPSISFRLYPCLHVQRRNCKARRATMALW
jgi:hypothetical protein